MYNKGVLHILEGRLCYLPSASLVNDDLLSQSSILLPLKCRVRCVATVIQAPSKQKQGQGLPEWKD